MCFYRKCWTDKHQIVLVLNSSAILGKGKHAFIQPASLTHSHTHFLTLVLCCTAGIKPIIVFLLFTRYLSQLSSTPSLPSSLTCCCLLSLVLPNEHYITTTAKELEEIRALVILQCAPSSAPCQPGYVMEEGNVEKKSKSGHSVLCLLSFSVF